MDAKTLNQIKLGATIGTAIVVAHGLTSKRWKEAHTFFVAAGALASLGLIVATA